MALGRAQGEARVVLGILDQALALIDVEAAAQAIEPSRSWAEPRCLSAAGDSGPPLCKSPSG